MEGLEEEGHSDLPKEHSDPVGSGSSYLVWGQEIWPSSTGAAEQSWQGCLLREQKESVLFSTQAYPRPRDI